MQKQEVTRQLSATIFPAQGTQSACFSAHTSRLHQLLSAVEVRQASGQSLSVDEGVEKVLKLLRCAKSSSKKVIVIGNGGSAAIASHLALDLWNGAGVQALTFNEATQLTCLGNDFGYENVFSKAMEAFAQAGDVLIAISSSGASHNILNAVETARMKGCSVLSFSGFDSDAPLRSASDLNFYVDSRSYGLVEVAHQVLLHYLADTLVLESKAIR